jgi:hypothetical protein
MIPDCSKGLSVIWGMCEFLFDSGKGNERNFFYGIKIIMMTSLSFPIMVSNTDIVSI